MITQTQQSTFLTFAKLPRELRNLVWFHAAHTPRNVHVAIPITSSETPTSSINLAPNDYTAHKPYFRAISPVPELLHTSQEARQEALRYYQLAFQQVPDIGDPKNYGRRMVYVNPAVDTLIIRTSRIGWHIIPRNEMNALLDGTSPASTSMNNVDLRESPWGPRGESIILANQGAIGGFQGEVLTFIVRSADIAEPDILPQELKEEINLSKILGDVIEYGYVGATGNWDRFWERYMKHVLVEQVQGVQVQWISDDFREFADGRFKRPFA